MRLVAGSYEKFIWGFSLNNNTTHQTLTLKPLFSHPSHAAPIRCCAASGPVAVSGGADDAIKIYDLSSSAEVGLLLHPSAAAVSALAFHCPPSIPFPRNLLAASDAGDLAVYDADPFVHLKTVHVHRKPVSDVAVHPTGRLALTVGRDACLSMVNLVRGRRSFYCRLDREAGIVRYAVGSGERFFMASEEKVGVHDSEDAKLLVQIEASKRVLCLAPGKNGLLYTGGEDRCVSAWDTTTGKVAHSIEDAHSSRIKGLVVLGSRSADDFSDAPNLVASASSDGVIRVWDMRMATKEKMKHLAEADTKSRLTCLAGSSIKFDFLVVEMLKPDTRYQEAVLSKRDNKYIGLKKWCWLAGAIAAYETKIITGADLPALEWHIRREN